MTAYKGARKRLTFRTTRGQHELIKKLAKEAGLKLNEWMVQQLERQVIEDEATLRVRGQ
jgi:predicted HicB family RNase H-like nuclease